MPNRRPKEAPPPADADARRAVAPVVCYPTDGLPEVPEAVLRQAREGLVLRDSVLIPPREARSFRAKAGQVIRISSVEGPQVGDLNLWNAHDLAERFYSGKTRALHGTHVTTGDRLWSSFPALRPMATVVQDTLDWYGIDDFGGAVHDVIGTRCDPYTHALLSGGGMYHHCCHSNLTRALAEATGLPLREAEAQVHDVLNVFMCTGFTRDTRAVFHEGRARCGPATTLTCWPRSTCWARCRPAPAATAGRSIPRTARRAFRCGSRCSIAP